MADTTTSPGANPTVDTTSTTTSSGSTTANVQAQLLNAKDAVVSNAQSTMASIQNHPTVQSIANGPVAENVKNQASLTSSEFQNLANVRNEKPQTAATGQPLTHYHSIFYSLVSWENPRATSIAFATSVIAIFMARYLNVLHYAFKLAYFILGVTATLEVAGKVLFDDGLASKMRPRKYWTVPRESIEQGMDEVEQLVNFFVIETQRIVYAENVYATIAVFLAAVVAYGLIKIVPFWGLTLTATCTMFLAPLVYKKNQAFIDEQLNEINKIVSSQMAQVRDLTAHHAKQTTETVKTYAGAYTQQAQELIGQKTQQAQDFIGQQKTETHSVSGNDFPATPKSEPAVNISSPGVSSAADRQAIPSQ